MSQSTTAFAAPTTNRSRPRADALVDEPVEAVLDDRDLPGRQPGHLLDVDVGADHVVTEVGEAGAGRQPDVSGPDDGDPATCGEPTGPHDAMRPSGPRPGAGRPSRTVARMSPSWLAAAPPDDGGLVEACGADPGEVCEAVWDRTADTTLAKLADWFIGRPALGDHHPRRRLDRRPDRPPPGAQVRVPHRVHRPGHGDAGAAARRGGDRRWPPSTTPAREARASSISTVVASTATVVIWVVAMPRSCSASSASTWRPLIAGAGIAGIAIGFGAQNLVKDCVAGLFMLIEDQYGIGDVVDLGVATGSVERVTLRTTVLRSQDGTVWHVPNGEIRRVGNRSKLWSVAVLDVVVAYDADLAGDPRRRARGGDRACASPRTSPATSWRRRTCSASSRSRADGVGRPAASSRPRPAPSSGCSAPCGRRSRSPSTVPASTCSPPAARRARRGRRRRAAVVTVMPATVTIARSGRRAMMTP